MFARPLSRLALGCLLAGTAGIGWAQQGIYTCVDGKGRRLTSDRPIPECFDREQKQLNASGTVRRVLGPQLTATERAAKEEQERKLAEERQRQADEKRVNRAMLSRYPSQAVHDAERRKALQAQQDVVASGQRRIIELQQQRAKLNQEIEFYKDASKWPPKLKRQVDEADQQLAAQNRFIAAQEEETKRINTRFDEELVRLKTLWAQLPPTANAAAAAASGPKKP